MNTINFRGLGIKYELQSDFFKKLPRWEPFTFDCIDNLCAPGTQFIDIGAWNGIFSLYAKLRGCNVVAAEPDIAARGLMKSLLNANGVRVELFEGALASSNGHVPLHNSVFGNSESSLLHRSTDTASHMVQTFTWDMFLHRYVRGDIALMKMDIEGSEVEVLNSMRNWLHANPIPLHISFHPSWADPSSLAWLFDIYDGLSDGDSRVDEGNLLSVLASHQHAILLLPK